MKIYDHEAHVKGLETLKEIRQAQARRRQEKLDMEYDRRLLAYVERVEEDIRQLDQFKLEVETI